MKIKSTGHAAHHAFLLALENKFAFFAPKLILASFKPEPNIAVI